VIARIGSPSIYLGEFDLMLDISRYDYIEELMISYYLY